MLRADICRAIAARHGLQIEQVWISPIEDTQDVIVRNEPRTVRFTVTGQEIDAAYTPAMLFDLLDERMWNAARMIEAPSERWVMYSAFCNQWVVLACCMDAVTVIVAPHQICYR